MHTKGAVGSEGSGGVKGAVGSGLDNLIMDEGSPNLPVLSL